MKSAHKLWSNIHLGSFDRKSRGNPSSIMKSPLNSRIKHGLQHHGKSSNFGFITGCIVILIASMTSFHTLMAEIDLNKDGVSDVFQTVYSIPTRELDLDHDKDGVSSRIEGHFGTDPLNSESVLRTRVERAEAGLNLKWSGVAGIRYQAQTSADLVDWSNLGPVLIGDDREIVANPEIDRPGAFYRIASVSPQDTDGDRLDDFEESLLGTEITRTFSDAVDGEGASLPNLAQLMSILGDMNGDGVVNSFDIDGFIFALVDPEGYSAQTGRDPLAGDINNDGALSVFDIEVFVKVLTSTPGSTVTIGEPSLATTRTGPVQFPVIYSGAATISLTSNDIVLSSTGTASGTVMVTEGTSDTPTIIIDSIVGDGTLRISIASGTSVDAGGTADTGAGPSATVKVDNTAPTLTIIGPSEEATGQGPISYAAVYDGADFLHLSVDHIALLTTGTATGVVTIDEFLVTISSITGEGSLGISIAAGASSDLAGNTDVGAAPSETFVVDNTPPSLTIGSPSVPNTSVGPVHFDLTYDGTSTVNLTPADVTLLSSGTAIGTVTVSNGTTNHPTVTIGSIVGNGTLGISIVAGTSFDLAGNSDLGAGASATVAVTNVGPTLTIGEPSLTETETEPFGFPITYQGANLVNLTANDVILIFSGTATGIVSVSNGTSQSPFVTVSSVSGSGTLGISIEPGTSSDADGNLDQGAGPSQLVTVGMGGVGEIEFVAIGSPGNVFDLEDGDSYTDGILNLGAVGYEYEIGKFEVTNVQYVAFLNAIAGSDPTGLFNQLMESNARGGIVRSGQDGNYSYATKENMGSKPVNFVSLWDAFRFCNWLHNGRLDGLQDDFTTENGAYTLTVDGGVTRAEAGTDPIHGDNGRNVGAEYHLPSENEWYKAAYYDAVKDGIGGYWRYPTARNRPPQIATADADGNIDNDSFNIANYSAGADWNGLNGNLTTVGSGGDGSASAFGAFDMAGNVWEMNEQVFGGSVRGLRGGSWFNGDFMQPGERFNLRNTDEFCDVGFRLARPLPPQE
jgi:formylglycine-generating enzyme required for sulfatase activity